MQINYFSNLCCKIKTKNKIIVFNPFNKQKNLLMPKTRADIVIFSSSVINNQNLSRIEGGPFIINGPGEYEIGGVSIFGIKSNSATFFILKTEEMHLCYLAGIKHKLTDKQLEKINSIDILFIPTDDLNGFKLKELMGAINKIEPSIIIPIGGFKMNEFLKEGGFKEVRREEKLVVKKSDLSEEMQIVLLSS